MDTAENQLVRSAHLAHGVARPKRAFAVGTRPPPTTSVEPSMLGVYLVAASLAIIALLLALSAL